MLYAAAGVFWIGALAAASVSTGGPSVDIHGWLTWIFIIGGVAGALMTIVTFNRKVIWPFVATCVAVAKSVESIPELHTSLIELHQYAHDFRHDAMGRITSLEAADVILTDLLKKEHASNSAKLDTISEEVHTSNELTMGQATDATESRRIANIPAAKRTAAEKGHITSVPIPRKRTPRKRSPK